MSYAALLVHVDVERKAPGRIALAAELASRFQATLIGVAGWSFLPSFLTDGMEVGAAESEQREMTALLAKEEESFRAATRHVRHVEWRGALDYASELVPKEARAADLVVVGQARAPVDPYFALNPGIAVLRAGRPVLVVPDAVEMLQARRVVVAWKDTREARRAVRDALPFLQQAERVAIAEVCESGTEMNTKRHIDDVAEYLRRHKVVVGGEIFLHAKKSAGAELVRFAHDEKSDLIVAGGYGHSRLDEWIFGGVTRELLASSPICCLFSH